MKVTEPSKPIWQSDEEQKTISVIVHTIRMSDVEDPDLYVAQPIYEWQQSEAGKWIMANSLPVPSWHRDIDHLTMGYRYTIRAYLSPKNYTFWKLKYG